MNRLSSVLTPLLKTHYLPIPLIALMVMTRYHHFGNALHLPDASLAVFFLAGFYQLSKKAFFAFLVILAGLIDYLAIANGTSAYCISPAYVFLIPTYGVMYLAGHYCSAFKALNGLEMALSGALVALAISTAFLISNASFYFLSDRFGEMSILEYTSRVVQYFPPYFVSALLYSLVGLGVMKAAKIIAGLSAQQSEA
ncbi:hypothetical protein JCM14076_14100 [Methylosoma difficile]